MGWRKQSNGKIQDRSGKWGSLYIIHWVKQWTRFTATTNVPKLISDDDGNNDAYARSC